MTAVLAILGRTWKIWVPALVLILVAGTLYAQRTKIKSLTAQRDVAVVEHDRAVEEQRQLLDDIARLDKLLLAREAQAKKLEVDLAQAKKRIAALAAVRPDVADWLDAPLPVGLWREVSGLPGEGAAGADRPAPSAAERAEDERRAAQPLPRHPQQP